MSPDLELGEPRDLLDDPEAMVRALWVAVGVLVLFIARQTYGALVDGGWVGLLVVTQLFLSGLAIVAIAVAGWGDLRRWSYPLAGWLTYLLTALGVFTFLRLDPLFFASDVSLFESYAAHLLVEGDNPMAADMAAARSAWAIDPASAPLTATVDGGVVRSYSYPGGTLWLSTIEAAVLPGVRLGITTLLASIAFLWWLLRRVHIALVPLVLLAWLAPTVRPASAAMGMITPLWLFPLAWGLAAWYDDREYLAAIGLGVAVASKQLAWPIAGLVLVHILRTRGRDTAQVAALITTITAGAVVSGLLVADPAAWAESVLFPFLPVGDQPELVAQGVGLTSLTIAGVLDVPRWVHTGLTLAAAASLVGATWRWPDRMQWVIPFATILVLVFHHRTLPSYYAAAVPLAVLALDARLRARPATPSPAPVPAIRRVDDGGVS
jgi:uncharacterized membrane protein